MDANYFRYQMIETIKEIGKQVQDKIPRSLLYLSPSYQRPMIAPVGKWPTASSRGPSRSHYFICIYADTRVCGDKISRVRVEGVS